MGSAAQRGPSAAGAGLAQQPAALLPGSLQPPLYLGCAADAVARCAAADFSAPCSRLSLRSLVARSPTAFSPRTHTPPLLLRCRSQMNQDNHTSILVLDGVKDKAATDFYMGKVS